MSRWLQIMAIAAELRDIERIIREHLETLRHEWDAFWW